MEILVSGAGLLTWRGRRCRCALGRAGVSGDKREGDGATPSGSFAMRRLLYRAERSVAPAPARAPGVDGAIPSLSSWHWPTLTEALRAYGERQEAQAQPIPPRYDSQQ